MLLKIKVWLISATATSMLVTFVIAQLTYPMFFQTIPSLVSDLNPFVQLHVYAWSGVFISLLPALAIILYTSKSKSLPFPDLLLRLLLSLAFSIVLVSAISLFCVTIYASGSFPRSSEFAALLASYSDFEKWSRLFQFVTYLAGYILDPATVWGISAITYHAIFSYLFIKGVQK